MAIPNPLIKFTYDDYLNTPDDKRLRTLGRGFSCALFTGRISSTYFHPIRGKIGSVRS